MARQHHLGYFVLLIGKIKRSPNQQFEALNTVYYNMPVLNMQYHVISAVLPLLFVQWTNT